MRKFLIAATVVALAVVPAAGLAHNTNRGGANEDIQDAAQCRASSDPVTLKIGAASHPTDAEDADRASLCVKNGSSEVLYIGGEVVSEHHAGPQTGVACGAVIVADQTRVGTDTENFNQQGHPHHNCD